MKQKRIKKSSCLFCQITKKEEKAWIILENEKAICFLDAFPVEKGHCLIIPKRCCKNILNLDASEATAIHELTKKACNILQKKFKSIGFNLVNNFNKPAGQLIDHYHLHVIPKYKVGYGFSWKKNTSLYNTKIESVWNKIKGLEVNSEV